MSHRPYCAVSGGLFALVALAHLCRIGYGMSVHVNEYPVPMFVSWIAFIVPAALAAWAFKMIRQ
ncbi:MAG: hypothetical protein GTO71_01000 [Woeseiaceae bacterium]|nr:hypothetical protein [Woeseiaceae bacterium]NIP19697.1 hypothetical protein [Woeseiaceae bacterium]NIS89814.1 hypothetical protein [Woeseiaceae bacterium]